MSVFLRSLTTSQGIVKRFSAQLATQAQDLRKMSLKLQPGQYIDNVVHSDRVVLFIDSYPGDPHCQRCAKAVDLLREKCVHFTCFDVQEDTCTHEALKKYSGCNTTPQLFVNGRFVGAYDQICNYLKSAEGDI